MDNLLFFTITIIVVAAFVILVVRHRYVIFEYQRGLLYRHGKFVALLSPGAHTRYGTGFSLQKVDVRTQYVTLPGQEVLSADNVSLKISLAAAYKISDPLVAVSRTASYQEALYLVLQLELRDAIGRLAVDDLLANREQVSRTIFEKSAQQAADLGLELELAGLRDIMFPGELRNIFAQVVNARKQGLAALERARGESAALRNLANAARLLENNPHLRQLRFLQTLEGKSGNTIVLLGDGLATLVGPARASGAEPTK